MMLAFGLYCTPFLVLMKYKFHFKKKKKSLLQVAHKIQLNNFMSILKNMTAKKGVKKTIGKYSRWKFKKKKNIYIYIYNYWALIIICWPNT